MATLTETSVIMRKIIRYTIYGVILIILARSTLNVGTTVFRTLFPPPAPPPTVGFGRLPKVPYQEKTIPQEVEYTLETTTGTLPVFVEQLPVYFMPPAQTNIRALDIAREKANSLGYDPNGRKAVELIESVYEFKNKNHPSTLTMNIVEGTFSISYDLNSDPGAVSRIPPAPEVAISEFKGKLSSAGLLSEDLSSGNATTELLKIENGRFVPALSLSDATITKANVYRKSPEIPGIDPIPAVTQQAHESNVWGYLSGADARGRIILAEYYYFPLDSNNFHTYPIKTAQEAWENLAGGNYILINLGDRTGNRIVIRRVYLAYYDPGQYTSFYQPVVVFEGDGGFVGYVPAVVDEYYGAEPR